MHEWKEKYHHCEEECHKLKDRCKHLEHECHELKERCEHLSHELHEYKEKVHHLDEECHHLRHAKKEMCEVREEVCALFEKVDCHLFLKKMHHHHKREEIVIEEKITISEDHGVENIHVDIVEKVIEH